MKKILPFIPELVLVIFIFFGIYYKVLHRDYTKINNEDEVIMSDGVGYYSYLPAIFIYHDLEYNYLQAVLNADYDNPPPFYFTNDFNGKKVNKYSCGEALLLLPFFFLAHLLSFLLGYPPDGYSILYQIAVWLAAVFYSWLGARYIFKTLLLFKIDIKWAGFIALASVFGTNLFYYVFYDPSMSHAYSFFAISFFIYYTKLFFDGQYTKAPVIAITLAIIALLRPINIIIVLILPLLADNTDSLKKGFNYFIKLKMKFVLSLVLFASVICIQLLLWKVQTGSWLIWSYTNEKLDFTQPHVREIFFSYKKGLFVYTPILFLSVVGLTYLFLKSKIHFFNAIVFIFITGYVLSSWWCWWYSMSFGLRAFIEFIPFFAILLGFAFKWKSKIIRTSLFILMLCCVYVNLVQAYQYRYEILIGADMTQKKYWKVFLKTDFRYRNLLADSELLLNNVVMPTDKDVIKYTNDCEKDYAGWNSGETIIQFDKALSGNRVCYLNDEPRLGNSISILIDTLPFKSFEVFAGVNYYLNTTEFGAQLAISYENNGRVKQWKSFRFPNEVNENAANKWIPISLSMIINNAEKGDIIKIYPFNPHRTDVYFDDFDVRIKKL